MILIYLFLTYIFTEFILRKFLTGKRASTTWIYAHEHLGFKQIEFTVFLLFIPSIVLVLWQNKNSEAVYTYGFTLVFFLQFVTWSIRGAEQWLYCRKQGDYIFCWMGASLMLLYACLFYFS